MIVTINSDDTAAIPCHHSYRVKDHTRAPNPYVIHRRAEEKTTPAYAYRQSASLPNSAYSPQRRRWDVQTEKQPAVGTKGFRILPASDQLLFHRNHRQTQRLMPQWKKGVQESSPSWSKITLEIGAVPARTARHNVLLTQGRNEHH